MTTVDRPKTLALVAGVIVLGLMPGSGSTRPAGLDISSIDGVYKRRFPNAMADGEKYTSEDVLEIVRLSPDRAYTRARINAANGHLCAIRGIAKVEGAALVYSRPAAYPPGSTCRLVIRRAEGKVTLSDGDSCRDTCGARAAYEGRWFETKARRKIRYMSRLKSSRDYVEAIAEMRR